MRECQITHKHALWVIEGIFPNMNKDCMLWAHYLMHEDKLFCCIQDNWWEVEYHWKTIVYFDEVESYVELGSIKKVEPPRDAVYSHSRVHQNVYHDDVSAWGDEDEVAIIVWEDNESLP